MSENSEKSFKLVITSHEPLRAKTVHFTDLRAETWSTAIAEAEGHIAARRQCYHDVESAKILVVIEEREIDVERLK